MLRSFTRGLSGLILASGLFLALGAGAVPITYSGGGTVTLTVSAGGTTLATVPSAPLDPGNFIEFDAAVPAITDLLLSITGVGPIALSPSYAGYDTAFIDSAALTPGTGYTGAATLLFAGPPADFYSYSTGNVDVAGFFSATGGAVPPIVMAPLGFTAASLDGSLFINTITGDLTLLGVTIGVIPAPVNSGLPDLVIKGDFVFSGVVPEPGTAVLLGAGLLGLLGFGRRAARRA